LDREQDEELHPAVIEALATLGAADPRVIERLGGELVDPDIPTSARWADAFALARMGPTGRRVLVDALAASPETVEREVVLRSLFRAGAPAAQLWEVAKPYLQADGSTWEGQNKQSEALSHLGGVSLPSEAWPILEPLLTSPDPEVAAMAHAVLYYFEQMPTGVRALIEADRAKPRPKVDVSYVKLGSVKEDWLLDLLFKEAAHQDENRRINLVSHLGTVSEALLPRALRLLAKALRDVPTVSRNAIQALETLGRRPAAAKRVYTIVYAYALELEAQGSAASHLPWIRAVLWRMRDSARRN
jgi:hypothetical protein